MIWNRITTITTGPAKKQPGLHGFQRNMKFRIIVLSGKNLQAMKKQILLRKSSHLVYNESNRLFPCENQTHFEIKKSQSKNTYYLKRYYFTSKQNFDYRNRQSFNQHTQSLYNNGKIYTQYTKKTSFPFFIT